jgi:DNA-binding beta-propeller fold protein YncE
VEGPLGKLYVSDAKGGAVFIYDASLNLVGELKGLDRPLGVAVDSEGNIYVGNDGRDNVEVYSPAGVPLFVIDEGNIRMPNDLAIDQQDHVYVTDSLSDAVKVYDAAGVWRQNIGGPGDDDGSMLFPVAVAVAYRTNAVGQEVEELYVADQGHGRVQVFDLEGNFLRIYGSAVSAFSTDWHGRFVKLQSLAVDAQGRLHAADSYLNSVQILDADTGGYLDSYGDFGTGVRELNVPLDIVVTQSGWVVVANAENHRVEVIHTVP